MLKRRKCHFYDLKNAAFLLAGSAIKAKAAFVILQHYDLLLHNPFSGRGTVPVFLHDSYIFMLNIRICKNKQSDYGE
jgi:hypothetical protein